MSTPAAATTDSLQNPPPTEDDKDTSDVELEGMDMEGDEEEDGEEEEGANATFTSSSNAAPSAAAAAAAKDDDNADEDEDRLHQLEEAEAKEMEAARLERLELLKAQQQEGDDGSSQKPKDAAATLQYLLGQSEVFAHFMAGKSEPQSFGLCLSRSGCALVHVTHTIKVVTIHLHLSTILYILYRIFFTGSVASPDGKKGRKKSASGGDGRGRKAGRLTEADEDAQLLKSAASTRRVIRLEKQPSLLSPQCKMHKYQLEGLNFLIHLHDCGIHGILADEM
jgi:SWI/SNF-related matrix-associated actin-dependent regulator of chromatin subfamily A member 5